MKKNIKRTTIILLPILTVALFFSGWVVHKIIQDRKSTGNIIFLWQPVRTDTKAMKLVLADGTGNNLRVIGWFSGTATFSHDGKKIAAGCMPNSENKATEICIVDVDIFKSIKSTMPMKSVDSDTAITNRIQLPEECLAYQSFYPGESEILSIDWSPKSDRLLVVCGTSVSQDVCILSLEGEPKCWDHEATEEVIRAVWSPVDENKILTSSWEYPVSKINLVDQNGTIIKQIAEGMNPEWSSDGTRIAYIENALDPLVYGRAQGIAVVDSDGLNHEWVYYPEIIPNEDIIVLDGLNDGRMDRLAWSPDDKTIVFSGVYGGLVYHRLFKLDLKTGYTTFLIDPWILYYVAVEPDWSPQ